jgi:hypothetical protein
VNGVSPADCVWGLRLLLLEAQGLDLAFMLHLEEVESVGLGREVDDFLQSSRICGAVVLEDQGAFGVVEAHPQVTGGGQIRQNRKQSRAWVGVDGEGGGLRCLGADQGNGGASIDGKAGVLYRKANEVGAEVRIRMRRILEGGGAAVAKVPMPSIHRRIGCTHKCEVHVGALGVAQGRICRLAKIDLDAGRCGVAGIGDGEADVVCAARCEGMHGVLQRRGAAVAKVPSPSEGRRVAEVRKVDGCADDAVAEVFVQVGTDQYRMADGCRCAIARDRQADVVGAGRSVLVVGVLCGGGIAIAKVPSPRRHRGVRKVLEAGIESGGARCKGFIQ